MSAGIPRALCSIHLYILTDHTFLLFNSQCPTETIGHMMTLAFAPPFAYYGCRVLSSFVLT